MNCSICLEDIKVSVSCTKTDCDHSFHTSCLKDWLKLPKYSCPNCRVELSHSDFLSVDELIPIKEKDPLFELYRDIFVNTTSPPHSASILNDNIIERDLIDEINRSRSDDMTEAIQYRHTINVARGLSIRRPPEYNIDNSEFMRLNDRQRAQTNIFL